MAKQKILKAAIFWNRDGKSKKKNPSKSTNMDQLRDKPKKVTKRKRR